MYFEVCDISCAGKIRPRGRRFSNQAIIQKFIDSNAKCAKITGWNHVDAYHCQRGFTNSAKRMSCPHIISVTRGGEVYLINTLIT